MNFYLKLILKIQKQVFSFEVKNVNQNDTVTTIENNVFNIFNSRLFYKLFFFEFFFLILSRIFLELN